MDERLQIFQDKMEKSLANLNEEFAGIRAGRANPHVLDKLRVCLLYTSDAADE